MQIRCVSIKWFGTNKLGHSVVSSQGGGKGQAINTSRVCEMETKPIIFQPSVNLKNSHKTSPLVIYERKVEVGLQEFPNPSSPPLGAETADQSCELYVCYVVTFLEKVFPCRKCINFFKKTKQKPCHVKGPFFNKIDIGNI